MSASRSRLRRLAIELALFVAVGAFMAVIGPYQTGELPAGHRLLYWLICILGGGVIGISIERGPGCRWGAGWRRVLATAVAMTLPVTLLVLATGYVLGHQSVDPATTLNLVWQVFVICWPIMAIRALVWRQPATIVETRTIVAPPLPEAEALFRKRLSARRRTARLIAIEAEDHYLRVHTDLGDELLTLRFADALVELAGAHGFQVHRSWWVAGDAIETVRWRRGAGAVRLLCGLSAPLSRTHAPTLRAAGWL